MEVDDGRALLIAEATTKINSRLCCCLLLLFLKTPILRGARAHRADLGGEATTGAAAPRTNKAPIF